VFTTDELAHRFRSDVADPLEGVDAEHPDSENLWKNWEVYSYMSDAVDATARETKGLLKTLRLPVVPDEPVVGLPRTVIDIRDAWLDSDGRQVAASNSHELLRYNHVHSRGRPRHYARDRERKAVVLSPTPAVADTLVLQCSVIPGVPMLTGMPLPLLDRPDQLLVLSYMKYLAYAKQDADTLDLARSQAFLSEFTRNAQAREVELRRERRLPTPIRMEW